MRKMTSGRKYSAPKLTVYGDMVKLTASGTSGNAENQGNTSASRMIPPQP